MKHLAVTAALGLAALSLAGCAAGTQTAGLTAQVKPLATCHHHCHTPPPTPTPTPTTPTPTPTTPTPTPTSTSWSCVTSSFSGGCDFTDPAVLGGNPAGGSSVRNQIWGPVSGETSTMRANGLQDWQDTINVPAGNTSVTGWPDSQATMTLWSQAAGSQPDPLSNYHSMTSTLTIASQDVPGAAYDNGFDVWGGPAGTSNDYAYEMMIWTDQRNRGTCGDVTVLGRATFGSDTYTLCRNGPAGPGSEYIWYHSDAAGNPVNQTTTTVDIYAMVQWMIANGYYPAGYGFDQITVGSEVCSTGGVPETVTLSKWTLAAS